MNNKKERLQTFMRKTES